MRIILVPGFGGHISVLDPLRRRLERDGHKCEHPGFDTNTLLNGELEKLMATLDRSGPTAVIGHSAGGLLAVLAAQTGHPNIIAVVGLGTPLIGTVKLAVSYYEAGSWLRFLSPLQGPNEVRQFFCFHSSLPYCSAVQEWVAQKLNQISSAERLKE